jgi:hypothetical protein
MSDINTTNINELPTDPTGGGSINGNVTLTASEQPKYVTSSNPNSNPNINNSVSLDQSTISQIVNGLQQASVAGATMLPSRDIPQSTNMITQDVNIQPNYIPQPSYKDYISEESRQFIHQDEKIQKSFDTIYDEYQTPILLAILYFIFQLPIIKKTLYKNMSFLCNNDGNYNLNGLIFVSALFGFIYYFVTKFITHFSKF